jgi:hypothetical protein
MKSFRYGTGLMGSTEPGQKVTKKNVHLLPPGSVVRLGDGSRLIHLHDTIWLWCNDHAWCYDRIAHLSYHIDRNAEVCHVAPST